MKLANAILFLAFLLLAGCLPLCSQENTTDEALARARALYAEQGARVALPEYERVLTEYRRATNRRGEGITLGLIGNCYKKLGDETKALALLTQALEIKREIHDRLEEGKTLSHLGLFYWEQGQYGKAI